MRRAKLFDINNFDADEAEENENGLLAAVFPTWPFILSAGPVDDAHRGDGERGHSTNRVTRYRTFSQRVGKDSQAAGRLLLQAQGQAHHTVQRSEI